MKEILKIRCQIYINEVIVLKKIQVTMKTFAPPFFQPLKFVPEQKKTCGNESHEKETKRIYASASDLLHIRIGNLSWCKCGHCKNEAREIDCLLLKKGGSNTYCLG